MLFATLVLAIPTTAGAQAKSPYLSPAGWTALSALNQAGKFEVTSADEAATVEAKVCDTLPPTNGDAQAEAIDDICRASARYVVAFFKTKRQVRAGAASMIRQGRLLEALSQGFADHLSGDCGRLFAATARYEHAITAATIRLSRDWRAGRHGQAAFDRWFTATSKAAARLVEEERQHQLSSCQPPAG